MTAGGRTRRPTQCAAPWGAAPVLCGDAAAAVRVDEVEQIGGLRTFLANAGRDPLSRRALQRLLPRRVSGH